MRFIVLASLGILLLALLLPVLLTSAPVEETAIEEVSTEPSPPPEEVADQPPALFYTLEQDTPLEFLDEAMILQVQIGDQIQAMTMADYLQGVVAAEMPARFHLEALKAQAVAARTYTLHRMLVAPTARHPEAYVCGDYACCKAYHSPERLRERWGDAYDTHRQTIAQAVGLTDGVILLYDGLPILAAFHAASSGFTEASGAIWNQLPYLQSVRTFESAAEVPRYLVEVELTFAEFRQKAIQGIPDVQLDESEIPEWISDLTYTDAGRLASVNIGGVTVTGAEFRRLFGLRSTNITLSFGEREMTIATRGHGHGVGMSQFGANTLAGLGLTHEAILDWYYTDITFARIDELLFVQ
ncbi:MAG: stage II sporulation protein D [Oscillospiraceae bacterium]|nr:stage II sporulation protein D [Oscillospiraceae bacterium]